MSGWIKLHRRSLENPVFKRPTIWHYWNYCLLKANHEEKKIIWNKKEMIIERGSFITGLKKSSKETGLTIRNIRTARKTLVNLRMIVISTTKTTTRFTYLTVCNYNRYQVSDNDSRTIADNQATIKRQSSDNQTTTNKNVKELKNEKNKPLPPIVPRGDDKNLESLAQECREIDRSCESDCVECVNTYPDMVIRRIKLGQELKSKNKIPEGFEEFYQAYPKKKNKPDALEAWKQIFLKPNYPKYHGPVPLFKILASVEAHKHSDSWRKNNGQYVPGPGPWLRAHGFNDPVKVDVIEREYEFLPKE